MLIQLQYSRRHTITIHYGRYITYLGDLDISFVLFNMSSKCLLHLECYLLSHKRHIKISKQIKQTKRYISITKKSDMSHSDLSRYVSDCTVHLVQVFLADIFLLCWPMTLSNLMYYSQDISIICCTKWVWSLFYFEWVNILWGYNTAQDSVLFREMTAFTLDMLGRGSINFDTKTFVKPCSDYVIIKCSYLQQINNKWKWKW